MVILLIFLLVLLVVAFYQSSQGLFNALIMCVLTICCAALALGLYEWVAIHWLAPLWKPDYAMALALTGLFGIPLIILRLVADKLVRRAPLLPGWMDRVGSGLCGLVTAFTLVGVMAFAVENLPFGGSILGYQRIPKVPPRTERSNSEVVPPAVDAGDKNLLLSPDRFAVGLVSLLSVGVFSGERGLGDDDPNLVQATAWATSAPASVSTYAPPNSISIVRNETVASVYTLIPAGRRSNEPARYESIDPKSGHEFRMIRVALRDPARDARKSHLFTLRQFRLVGTEGPNTFTQYHPIATQQPDASESTNRYIRHERQGEKNWPVVDDLYLPREDHPNEVEIVFELPKSFKPMFLEYKRGARAKVEFASATASSGGTNTSPGSVPSGSASAEPAGSTSGAEDDRTSRRRRSGSDETVATSGRGGRVRGFTTLVGQSFFGDKLPLELKSYDQVRDVELQRGVLANGQLHGVMADQNEGKKPAVSRFKVPNDKRLLQLNTGRLQSRSGFGQALDLAARTVQNYVVETANGEQYKVIGKYAIADVDGQEMIEVQYYPDQAGTMGGLGQFRKIDETKLKGDYVYVLLFLVDPGAKITSFSTGGSASRRDDLSGEDLVAPQ